MGALEAKIQVLEERLNNKKEQLLEKELVLEEITNLSDKLRKQALDGRQDTLILSEKVNSFQSQIKTLTRQMMATVSELSMFQATAMKLQQEKGEKEEEIEIGHINIEKDLAPSAESELEWFKLERTRIRKEKDISEKIQKSTLEANMASTVTRTTAEPRPNAYFADNIGIPYP